ncbi:hypothetical protein ACH4UT_30765 [Streptomyces sp. NPDC020799]|uniref:hypothetical protein n=1 Tax=Streptomyces sp. NPDC020799 TaxID=3365091 RepID=UPI0037AB50C9
MYAVEGALPSWTVSLIMDRPIRQSLGGWGPLVQARAAGLTTFASSPLHGGELIDLMPPRAGGVHPPWPLTGCRVPAGGRVNPEPGHHPS